MLHRPSDLDGYYLVHIVVNTMYNFAEVLVQSSILQAYWFTINLVHSLSFYQLILNSSINIQHLTDSAFLKFSIMYSLLTKQWFEWLALLHIQKVMASELSQGTGCPDAQLLWFSLFASGKCWDSISS
jgi:hypothetical protein